MCSAAEHAWHRASSEEKAQGLNLRSKEEVDDLYRRWCTTEAKLISAPESKSRGLHEFTAADPDGNLIRVHPVPNCSLHRPTDGLTVESE
jgi:hypothetical protein